MTEAEAAAEIERLTKERDDAREWGVAQIERLTSALHYEENRLNRIGTHGERCFSWGPQHYECALQEIKRQREVIETWREGYIEQTGTDE
ncbi:hypothetical protein UFOVP1288_20 [uncultured Caudovirales phage]|uniref:Uncharacterized protein n=1 Tax=uncultured Caudovirales phage TaxID=2100421 RepID=A0A6J5R1L4_9CAUD|nr:hypothetical protein UFOVP1195_20 [uncultured Caudovirales phage]CAB4195512.1 hypothetical protein UFOVP1288_20 [uncultured Caudovirales phage]CAB4204921.1 hypothetical protein UFOVP1409_20 [uncultured Caudovirales phage]